jgi:apolipoprotein N-acyltransferase
VNNKLIELSERAVFARGDLDLLIWPETTWGGPIPMHDADLPAPVGSSKSATDAFRSLVRKRAKEELNKIQGLATRLQTPLLIGANVLYAEAGAESPDDFKNHNSALFIDTPGGKGKFIGRYDKMHPVIFGEYVPFGDYFPWVYDILPINGGLDEGDGPQAFEVGGVRLSPSICYETMAPHKTRDQIAELRDSGREPDVIVNLTNDGWFWGSAELDLHLICGVFRAVENRKPLLVAANTGFSAYVDSSGRIIQQGPRHEEDILFAEVPITPRGSSLYLRWGDWFAWACFALCAAAVAWAIERRFKL